VYFYQNLSEPTYSKHLPSMEMTSRLTELMMKFLSNLSNPILYDKSCKDYKNSEMKKEVWKVIAISLDGVSDVLYMFCYKY